MIIVFGSLNIDIVMPVKHFPKPGETVLCDTDYLSRPGGKGANQATAAVRAGGKVAMVGKVGDDSFGRRCVQNLKNQSVWTSGIALSEERPTGCAMIAVDPHGENIVMVAPGANLETASDQVPDELFTSSNVFLTQMEISPEATFSVLKRAKEKGSTTIFNPSPTGNAALSKEVLLATDYLIVNEIEALQLAHNLNIAGSDPKQLAKKLATHYDLTCIITLEAKGAIAARKNDLYQIAALPVEVIDSTGAGDAFCGIFAACLQSGKNWLAALHYASIGASLSCLGLGAQESMPFMDNIESHLEKIPPAQKAG